MPRIPHGRIVRLQDVVAAHTRLAAESAGLGLAFTAGPGLELTDFDFLFPELAGDPASTLPESRATRDALVDLGRAMIEEDTDAGDSPIPAAYTYLGQFIDHDITLEVHSADLPRLLAPDLAPLAIDVIRDALKNTRTATFDLDSVYGIPAPRDGDRMQIGKVTPLAGNGPPTLRPAGKDDLNDVPRQARDQVPENDRAALIGDPRNDENTIISQLQVAFLRAHNTLVSSGMNFEQASRELRRRYQEIVLYDFLPRICDPAIVDRTIQGNRVYDAMQEPFFMPLEFSVAVYRFGHSMVRADYDFNVNFNLSRNPGTLPASLDLLFTFTALSGQLGNQQIGDFDTLPDNWIIEWERLVDAGDGTTFQKARLIDPLLVEPLFRLPDIQGLPPASPDQLDFARLAVRNLLRGYLLRMPTGQALANAVNARLGSDEIPVLSPQQLTAAALNDVQRAALDKGGFLDRTPLWYYILAEAKALANGHRLGPLGSTIVAEVLVGLVRRSDDSILRTRDYGRSQPPAYATGMPNPNGRFRLVDLLRLGGVLGGGTPRISSPTATMASR